jgi:hypothetical protein
MKRSNDPCRQARRILGYTECPDGRNLQDLQGRSSELKEGTEVRQLSMLAQKDNMSANRRIRRETMNRMNIFQALRSGRFSAFVALVALGLLFTAAGAKAQFPS